jgi:hypothetical protein
VCAPRSEGGGWRVRGPQGAQNRGPVWGCPRVDWNCGRSPARPVLVGVPGHGRFFQEAVSGSLDGGGEMSPLSMVWSLPGWIPQLGPPVGARLPVSR